MGFPLNSLDSTLRNLNREAAILDSDSVVLPRDTRDVDVELRTRDYIHG